MELDERLRRDGRTSRGDLPVRVIVCHWSRTRPGVQHERVIAARLVRRRARRRRHELRLAARREEPAVGEQARRRGHCRAGRGHWNGRASRSRRRRSAPPRRYRSRASRRSRTPRAARARGRSRPASRNANASHEAHAPRDLRDDPPVRLRFARQRQETRAAARRAARSSSRCPTSRPSPPPAAARRAARRVGVAHAIRDDDELALLERAPHALRVRHADDGVRRHDPDRLHRAALDGLEQVDGLEARAAQRRRGAFQKRATRATLSGVKSMCAAS